MDISPDGKYVYAALRGPCPVTGNAPAVNNAVGATPGVGVIKLQQSGFKGKMIPVAPINNQVAPVVSTTVGGAPTLTERADPHTLKGRLQVKPPSSCGRRLILTANPRASRSKIG